MAAHELKAQAQAHRVLYAVEVYSGGPEAELHGQTALRIFEELGDLSEQAHMLNNMGARATLEGHWPDALLMFTRAADTYRRLGDGPYAASSDYNRAEVLVRQGRSDEARPHLAMADLLGGYGDSGRLPPEVHDEGVGSVVPVDDPRRPGDEDGRASA